jgi:hypothetical protein
VIPENEPLKGDQSGFVDLLAVSQYSLAVGTKPFITRNLKEKGVAVTLKNLKVTKNYF